jgi:hypothetical protein
MSEHFNKHPNINYNENPLLVLDLLYEDRRIDRLGEGKREIFVTFGS